MLSLVRIFLYYSGVFTGFSTSRPLSAQHCSVCPTHFTGYPFTNHKLKHFKELTHNIHKSKSLSNKIHIKAAEQRPVVAIANSYWFSRPNLKSSGRTLLSARLPSLRCLAEAIARSPDSESGLNPFRDHSSRSERPLLGN